MLRRRHRHRFREPGSPGHRREQAGDDVVQFNGLAERVHARVTCHHLFDQRAAQARHPDDEDRHLGGIASSPFVAKQLRRKNLRDPPEPVERRRFVVDYSLALQRVALQQMSERCFVLLDIVISLGQRKMELDLCFQRMRAHIAR
jgi:hypothetical protein